MTGVPLLLPAYRLATRAFTPFAPALLRRRERRGKEDRERLGERLGRPGRPRPEGPLAWLHGASVGESLTLLPLVEALRARGLAVLMTSGTATSARLLGERLPPGALHQFVPVDVPRFISRFLAHWRPDMLIMAESELWPNLLLEARRRRVPVVLVNARMSDRSLRRWRRAPAFIGRLLEGVDLCLAQTETDARRYAALGAPATHVMGNLKYDAPPPAADPAALAQLRDALGERRRWIAASTHPGEDEIVLDAHRRTAERHPDLLTIIAPRHPERGPAIAALAASQGLSVALRSQRQPPGRDIAVYVADTIGELGLFFRLAPLAFVGKSLAGGGGQNPIEPAKLGCAVLHGPLVGNFEDVYRTLAAAGGARVVGDAATLAAALDALLTDAARLAAMTDAARATVAGLAGARECLLGFLEPILARTGLPA